MGETNETTEQWAALVRHYGAVPSTIRGDIVFLQYVATTRQHGVAVALHAFGTDWELAMTNMTEILRVATELANIQNFPKDNYERELVTDLHVLTGARMAENNIEVSTLAAVFSTDVEQADSDRLWDGIA